MKTTSLRARTLACALLATTAYCGLAALPAAAQTYAEFRHVDANGVDLVNGTHLFSFEEGAIGSGPARLALVRQSASDSRRSQWDGYSLRRTSTSIVEIRLPGGRLESFALASISPNGTTVTRANGSRLTKNMPWSYTYVSADGTALAFGDPTNSYDSGYPPTNFCTTNSQSVCDLLPEAITAPNGQSVTFGWGLYGFPGDSEYLYRLGSVANGFGYLISFNYASNDPAGAYYLRTGAEFFNTNVSSTPQSSVSYAYPSSGVTEITDMAGQVWRIAASSSSIGIRRPGASSDTGTISLSSGKVIAVTHEGVTTGYARTVSGTTATMVVEDALGNDTTVVSNLTAGRPTSITDPLGRTTGYSYDSSNRLTRVTAPEGNYVQLTLDARGNVTQTQLVPKSGSGAATIAVSASYPSTCTNVFTCNSPTSITDARGNVTDYTYDSTHGGVLTVTAPAPTAGATRPQTRYSYTLTNGEYLPTGVSQCQTTSSCAGTADEVKSSLAYDTQGNVTSTSSGNGSGTLTATTAMTYTAMGDVATVDGPLSGTADTVKLRYDSARRHVGTVGPDPDGGGALKHRAVRNTIGAAGQVTKVESGTVNSQSDSDWAAFAALEAVETGYDANLRPTTQKLVSGSTPYALTQTSYDALGRPECTAQRMNPSEFASLPASACTLDTQGSHGPDRISKTIRDAAGQVTQVKTALGVAGQEANEVTATYTSNGLVQTVTDAENNKTTYEYDGHDRLAKMRFPSPAKGAGTSSTTDYEQPGYDANGNVVTFRNRANETTAFSYDALDRLTTKNRPGSELDVAYAYDLLGRMTSAATSAQTLAFAWDALGRQLSQTDGSRIYSSQYDLAGRRTRLTHPDGFYVQQDFLVTGEMTKIRENGATSGVGVLATYGYDSLGRRSSLTFGNGESASYSYDAVSRLSQLVRNLGGTTNDLTLTFSYNPASQIVSTVRSNDLYAWTGHGSGTTSTTADGLNRIAGWNGTLTYDAKGNMTSDGTKSYAYDSENKLHPTSPSFPFYYDPLGRLAGAGSPIAIHYENYVDGLIAERLPGSSNITFRHVFGPGSDEPIVWYNGSGTSDRRFLHADERGSIVAVTDSSAGLLAINRYDEYGKTETSNSTYMGRFLYTGQRYFGASGLYYYKNRFYHPGPGRFMQTDPIGYDDGMNPYAYVGGDPVNFTDPLGLAQQDIVITGRTTHPQNPFAAIETRTFMNHLSDVFRLVEELTCRADPENCVVVTGPKPKRPKPQPAAPQPIGPTADPNPDPRRDGCGNPLPPASRQYSLPPGYKRYVDPRNRTVKDPNGKTVNNPYYQFAFDRAKGIDSWGVASDLGEIAGAVIVSQALGAVMRFSLGPTRGPQVQAANRVDASAEGAARSAGGPCSR